MRDLVREKMAGTVAIAGLVMRRDWIYLDVIFLYFPGSVGDQD